MVKNPSANAGDIRDRGLIPGSGRSPRGGHGNPLQYSCLEKHMDRGAWQMPVLQSQPPVLGSQSWTWLKWLAILCNSAFKWVYLSFSPLHFASLLFKALCTPCSDNYFAFLHFFFLGMVLIPASCTMSQISVHTSSGTLSDPIPWIYFSLPLYNQKGFDLGHTWMV